MNKELNDEIGRIGLFGCGVVSLNPLGLEANKEESHAFEVELYVNRMAFKQ